MLALDWKYILINNALQNQYMCRIITSYKLGKLN